MSEGLPRPEPLSRLVRRSDRRCLVAAVWFVLLVVFMAADGLEDDRVFAGTPIRTATVDDDFDPAGDDRTVPVHLGDRLVETRAVIDGRLPGAGDEVRVEVDPDRPDVVRIVGSEEPTRADFLLGIGPLAVCGVLAAGRRRFVRRAVARAGADTPSFGLSGRLRSSQWSRHRCVLDLYALDAGADAGPVASVTLASSGALPLEQPFPVECKGVPRPYGLVVARAGDTVLWPATPATGGRGGTRRGHDRAGAAEPLRPGPTPATTRVRPLRRRVGPWLLAPAVALLVGVAVVGRVGVLRDRDRLATWDQYAAEVVESADCAALVRVDLGDGPVEQRIALGDCSPPATGAGYDVLVDPEEGTMLLVGSLYDPWTPLILLSTLLIVALARALHDRTAYREAVAAAAGPWLSVVVDADPAPAPLRSPADPPGSLRGVLEGGSALPRRPGAVHAAMAGDIGPGGSFVLSHPGLGTVEEHRGAGRARRRRWRPAEGA